MQTIEQKLDSGQCLRLSFLTPSVVRIQLSETGEFPDTGLNRYGFVSPPEVDAFSVLSNDGDGKVSASTDSMTVTCSSDGQSLTVTDADGETRLAQVGATRRSGGVVVRFAADPDEDWMGFGDQTRDRLFHRGHVADCQVRNVKSYIPVPFFMSTMGVGVVVNTTHRIVFDMCKSDPDHYEWRDARGVVDYYVIIGDSFRALLDSYTSFTGRPQLPPQWSFGLWYICRTQAHDHEVISDALNFRREGIPCDVIGLEPGWMEKNYDESVDKTWSKERFPIPSYCPNGPHNFVNALKRMGFKLELWLCCDYDFSYEEERRIGSEEAAGVDEDDAPFFHEDGEVDQHFGRPRYLDRVTKRDQPWFEHLKKFVDQGADFFKQDGAYQVLRHPDRLWGNGMLDAEMHNLYPLLYVRQMLEGFEEHTGRRGLTFTPAGWIGFQAWAGTWTGDTGGRLETLGAMLNTAAVGHSWATNDMEVTQKEGIHFGYLLPWAQINSWNYFRMPWIQGDELRDMHRFYARLRARLIPYIYSWAYHATQTGFPLLAPLPLAFQDDPATRDVMHQFMLGRDMLVTIYKKKIYLPDGLWKDVWTGAVVEGGQTVAWEWPENRGGGLFLREGAIIPMYLVMEYREECSADEVELYIFPGADESTLELYEDDGTSLEHRDGRSLITRVSAKRDGSKVLLSVGEPDGGGYKGQPTEREWTFRAAVASEPKTVEVNGSEIADDDWEFDAERNEVRIVPIVGAADVVISL